MARPRAFDCADALDRALETFLEHGYEATSMQNLVDAMGISRQSLYDTYKDKRTLYLSALHAYDLRQREALRKAMEQPGPVRELLRGILYSMVAGDNPGCRQGCFVVNSHAERPRTRRRSSAC